MSSFTRSSADIWKGIAIWTVVLVHFVAVFPESFYFNPLTAWWIIPFQSLVRFSVPLFLALSGYGLAKKYTKKTVLWKEYLPQRLGKLFPLYLLWSFTVWFTLQLVPQWRIMPEQPIWKQLLLGTADYQLYFVPLIVQLYLLFPVLHKLKSKALWIMTALTLVGQVILALLFRWSWFQPGIIPQALLDDQIQYRLFFNWWGYFLLGMLLAKNSFRIFEYKHIKSILLIFVLTTIAWASYDSQLLLQSTQNIIFATSFLRIPIIFFAIFSILLTSQIHWERFSFLRVAAFLKRSGRYSYLIFLSHTTFLRLVLSLLFVFPFFAIKMPPLTPYLVALIVSLLALALSLIPSKKK